VACYTNRCKYAVKIFFKRQRWHRLPNAAIPVCEPGEVAITRNTTDGVATVIAGLKLNHGDGIIVTTQEPEDFYGILYQRAARDGLSPHCTPDAGAHSRRDG
jgi:hypothetical protein